MDKKNLDKIKMEELEKVSGGNEHLDPRHDTPPDEWARRRAETIADLLGLEGLDAWREIIMIISKMGELQKLHPDWTEEQIFEQVKAEFLKKK